MLVNANQAAEHQEIDFQGTLVALARRLGRDDVATLLQQRLNKEKQPTKKLTKLALVKLTGKPSRE